MTAERGRGAVCVTLDVPDPGAAAARAAREGVRCAVVLTPGDALSRDHRARAAGRPRRQTQPKQANRRR